MRPNRYTRVQLAAADKLHENLSRQSQSIQSARELFSLTLRKGIEKQRLKQVVVFQRPDRLRSEFFLPGILQTSALVVARDGTLESLDVTRKTYTSGVASVDNARRLLAVPFTLEELMLWTTGTVFIPNETRATDISYWLNPRNDHHYAVIPLEGEREVQVEFVLEEDRPRLLALDMLEGLERERVFVSRFIYSEKDNDGSNTVDQTLPQKIEFWALDDSLSGELERESTSLYPPELPLSLFRVYPPRAYTRSSLDTAE
ncbi:MAG: hypothetical protein IT290_12390 [Deltaproteobacteria bacterium]|nr:hypothetical protein [Deltaproteobacteria bacterium]